MGRWTASVLVAVGYLLLTLAVVLLVASGWASSPDGRITVGVYAVAYTIAYGGVLASTVDAWRRVPERRTPFTLALVAAWAAYALGDVVSDLTGGGLYDVNKQVADPGDALTLGAYALVLAGFARTIVRSRRGIDLDRLLDGCIVLVALGTVVWVLLVSPGLRSHLFVGQPASAAVAAAMPVLDLLLVALGMAYVLDRRPISWSTIVALAAPLLLLLGDAFSFVHLIADEPSPPICQVGWLLGIGAVATAAQMPPDAWALRVAEGPSTRHRALRTTWICAAGLVPVALYLGEILGPDAQVQDGTVLSAAMLVMLALVVARAGSSRRIADAQSEDLQVLARSDHLTGLPNRRTSDAELSRAVARAALAREPLTVAILDLDRFKDFNDTYGHHAGDELLTGCAHRWQEMLGPQEVLARYGGEEFLLIAPGLPTSAVVDLVDRLRRATPRGQSFSAGVARWRRGEPEDSLVARADDALYAAKAGGRARTHVWETGAVEEDLAAVPRGGALEAGEEAR